MWQELKYELKIKKFWPNRILVEYDNFFNIKTISKGRFKIITFKLVKG